MATPSTRGGGVQTPGGYKFEITGGDLALDLANTVDLRPTPEARELLRDWTDLVDWSVQVHAVDAAVARHLKSEGARRPEEAGAVLRRVRFLRELLFRLFSTAVAGRPQPPDDFATFNDALSLALQRLRLAATGDRHAWAWVHPDGALDVMIPPVVQAAAALLIDAERLSRVRICEAGDRCAWLFLDLSRNRSRRWCDMTVCGNREKARRHYQRVTGRKARRRGADR